MKLDGCLGILLLYSLYSYYSKRFSMLDKSSSRQWRLETLALHGRPTDERHSGPHSLPICQTAAFTFDSSEQAAARFALDDFGPIYSRLGNPTVDAFEERMAAIE